MSVSRNTHFSRGRKVGATEPPELPPVLGDGLLGLRCPVGSHLPVGVGDSPTTEILPFSSQPAHPPERRCVWDQRLLCVRGISIGSLVLFNYHHNVAEVEQYIDANCYISISILILFFSSRCHATGCGFITTQQVRTTILHCGTYLRIILQTCGCVQISYHFIKGSSEQASSISWTEKGFSSYFRAIVYIISSSSIRSICRLRETFKPLITMHAFFPT